MQSNGRIVSRWCSLAFCFCLTVSAADLPAANACYNKDCFARSCSGRYLPGDTKKETSEDIDHTPLELLMKESAIPVRLMERYVELRGKQVRRPTLNKSVYENVEDLVVLWAGGYRLVVFFRHSTTAALKMLKDVDDDDDLEAALDVVPTHIRKQRFVLEYSRRTHRTPPMRSQKNLLQMPSKGYSENSSLVSIICPLSS